MSPDSNWIARLAELRAASEPCALVVVTGVKGSAPREVGARMVVRADGGEGVLDFGTIGGGNLEHQALAHAAALIARGEAASETVAFPLAERTGQCCGGEVTLFFETFSWRRPTVAIFGAGHVGQALAGLAPWLGARVLLIDGRHEEQLVPAPPAPGERPYELVCIDAPEGEVDALPADALVLIMTHDHALDLEILARALKRGGFPYLGLIGSARKWLRFQRRLEQRGVSADQLASVTCPIGLTQGSKTPSAIALSVAAELSQRLAPGAGATRT